MKSWSCIEFVFIQLSLTGLPQPRTGRQFIAWGVSPRNPEPSNDDPEPPKGAAEGEAWRCLIATRRSFGSRSSVAPVGGSGQQSWWLPLDFTSPGADAARLGTSAAPRLANLAPGRFRRFRATKQQRNPPWNWNVQPQLFITSRGGLAVSRSTLQHARVGGGFRHDQSQGLPMLSPAQSFRIPLARREESFSISKAPAPPPLAPSLQGLSFTHISLLTEVLTIINIAAIFNNYIHLFKLSTESNENTLTV